MGDYCLVGCERCREALSARLDGEPEPTDPAVTDGHLAGCAACRRWVDDAARLRRLLSVGSVDAGSRGPADRAAGGPAADWDLAPRVLRAAPGPAARRLAGALRLVLGGIGVVQFVFGMAQVADVATAAAGHRPVAGLTPEHLWHESAAWNVAVGVGFLVAALRPARPGGLLAVLTAFLAILTLVSVDDLLAGQVGAGWLASHLPIALGYLIVLALDRPRFAFGPPGRPAPGAAPDAAAWRTWRRCRR